MRYGAMNFPIKPVLKELEAFAHLGFDYLELTLDPPLGHYSIIRKQKDEILDCVATAFHGTCLSPSDISIDRRSDPKHSRRFLA